MTDFARPPRRPISRAEASRRLVLLRLAILRHGAARAAEDAGRWLQALAEALLARRAVPVTIPVRIEGWPAPRRGDRRP